MDDIARWKKENSKVPATKEDEEEKGMQEESWQEKEAEPGLWEKGAEPGLWEKEEAQSDGDSGKHSDASLTQSDNNWTIR